MVRRKSSATEDLFHLNDEKARGNGLSTGCLKIAVLVFELNF
jgi:hypothetical protein